MYKQEFEQILKTKLPKSVLFYGENQYAIEQYIKFYITKLQADNDKLKLYFDDYDFEKAKSYLSQNSLFGNVNLLIIKSEKAIVKKELELLLEMTKKSQNNYFLYVFFGSSKDIKTSTSLFRSNDSVEVRLFEPSIKDSIMILQNKAKYIGLNIDNYALEYLTIMLGNNLMLCSNELDKLNILNREITTKDINEFVFSQTPLSVEKLLINVCNKKLDPNIINTILDSGEDANSILRATQNFLNQILLFQAYIKINGTVNSQDILGYKLPKQIEEQKATLANRIKSSRLLKAFEHVLQCELEIKSAPAPQKETLLYSMFIELQNIL
ncbi:MAG: DNA polymerase III subunit delta [Epsilonproteobacteria bacterium]|nr:DNA polymerase III subunit delta [Campylobacterota bacterium]